jgi:phosphate transport system substrate-binding protein
MIRSRSATHRMLLGLALVTLLGACVGGDDNSSSGGTAASTTTQATAKLSGTLNASGATFPQAFYEEVIAGYKEVEPDVTINYGGGGSGKGRQELQDMVVDFAGSDGLVKPEDVAKFKGGEFLYVPTITAPITVSYNLPDVAELKLDAPTTAKIFQREIKTWDNAAIKALNPGLELPSTAITVVHRSDGSGTTENFTKYLATAAPGVWKLASGSTVEWPADTQGGNGNTGVAQAVKGATGAIGYVDLSDARASQLQIAQLKNKAGKYVKADVDSATAALEGVVPNADLSYNPLDAAGDDAYPITAPTWILVYKNQTDRAKADTIKSFLTYLLGEGQELAPDIDYAPLPDSFRQKALAQLDNIVLP